MITEFVDTWFAYQDEVRNEFSFKHPSDYIDIVRIVIKTIAKHEYRTLYHTPDPERIHEINDGDYQGTVVYVIGAQGYQPSDYWYVKVGYGSCSGCDTLERIREIHCGNIPNEQQVNDYMTLGLHIVQGLREMGEEEV